MSHYTCLFTLQKNLYTWECNNDLYVYTLYLPLLVPLESTLILCNALAEVKDWELLGVCLNIPDSKRQRIAQQYPDPANLKAKEEILRIFLAHHPAPSWATVTEALYRMGQGEEKYICMLQEVRRLYGTGTYSGCYKSFHDCSACTC